jgi:dipeptidase E
MKALLLSCSFLNEGEYLKYAEVPLKKFLEGCPSGHILFVPYAVSDYDTKTERARKFLSTLKPDWGSAMIALHHVGDIKDALRMQDIKAIFVTGGNTFRLLKTIQDLDILGDIRSAIGNGAGYIGVSAGANLACPTIMTTNDMPIVQPRDFNALRLVDFQINPHFPTEETDNIRKQLIVEYINENNRDVVGLPDGSLIEIKGDVIKIEEGDATLFSSNDLGSGKIMHAGDVLS